MKPAVLVLLALILLVPSGVAAQERPAPADTLRTDRSPIPAAKSGRGDNRETARTTERQEPDTAVAAAETDTLRPETGVLPKLSRQQRRALRPHFVPDPKRALWLSLVMPGAGQIYNRKYWKLPIVYGGFLGCTYALTWNQQMYLDYSQAYLDIMDGDPTTNSFMDMLPPHYDITGREEQLKNILKRRKDRYRRYRDMSAFCFVGVYLISVIDAYVDAQLSTFDISPDLSMRLGPSVIENHGLRNTASYGVGCSLNF